jgi:hypothetical protein
MPAEKVRKRIVTIRRITIWGSREVVLNVIGREGLDLETIVAIRRARVYVR